MGVFDIMVTVMMMMMNDDEEEVRILFLRAAKT
jgi:hypothetical protein